MTCPSILFASRARIFRQPLKPITLEASVSPGPGLHGGRRKPPASTTSKKKKEDPLLGAANDFQALERLRRLAFADQVPEPKIPEQALLELVPTAEDEEDDGEAVE